MSNSTFSCQSTLKNAEFLEYQFGIENTNLATLLHKPSYVADHSHVTIQGVGM